ncbi:MAG TPA: bifunctional 4-hydroxy-2-oxoglutarate aldolase/2-dehydro-3-deoxy-phosphogluconate aldolase [Chitinophagaceae bacterium]|nr:bifunctional 4-hydroxy-2-oxoglutarate aldolase/2-dehydro-3-deoxy-phosphogluconate aldolase [Chitinophagaceae bacterium]
MRKKQQAEKALLEQKLLPLYYHESAEVSIEILKALYQAGVLILEYTNRGGAALKNFTALRKAVDKEMPGLQLGIGTIKNRKQAKKYIDAGADFIVCPSINEQVAKIVQDAKLLWIPGCMTPTEIAAAENAGATIVKIFPGNILGPGYVSAIKDLFPGLKFIPTGGVEMKESNLRDWFKAGVVAVGMGSKLITKEMIEEKNYNALKEATVKTLEMIRKC